MAVKHRPPDRGGRPLTRTYRSSGREGLVYDGQPPVSSQLRTLAPDPLLPFESLSGAQQGSRSV